MDDIREQIHAALAADTTIRDVAAGVLSDLLPRD